MRCDIQMQPPTRAMFNHDKDVEHAEGRGGSVASATG
jgi:hypothetical protein